MADANVQAGITQIDIGLSKEDQDRIDKLRRVDVDKKKKTLSLSFSGINEFIVDKFSKVNLREKVTFYQLLAVMINSGVPIIRSLYVLSDQNKNPKFRKIIRSLGKTMEEGNSLSFAMEKYPDLFGDAERGMIASGEASGNLNEILKDIAKQTEKSAMILAKVKGAMIYPTAIMVIMAIAVFLMLTLVVPKITEIFVEGGQELPTSTKLLVAMSDFARNSWGILLLIIAAIGVGFSVLRKNSKGKYLLHTAILYLPIFGKLIRELMIARFARMLASLMEAGLPIVKTLEINANAIGNEVYKRRIEYAAQDVAQGIPLGENLTGSEFLFPPMVASMVLVGEQTANLVEVSTKIAEFYETEVDNAVGALSKLMEPVILVVMGGIVGFIVAAVMQPIMALSDLSSVI